MYMLTECKDTVYSQGNTRIPEMDYGGRSNANTCKFLVSC